MSATDVDFNLPSVIKDFLFDLHDATRRSARIDEVQRLYDAKFKEITDKYFAQSPWPETKVIASEVGNDEGFLVFYRFVFMLCIPRHSFPSSNWSHEYLPHLSLL